jgi:hypothetical protein
MSNICIELHYIQYRNEMGFEDIIIIENVKDEEQKEKLIEKNDVHHVKAYFRDMGWSEFNNDKEKFTEYQGNTNTYEVDGMKLLKYEFQKLFQYIEDNGEKIEITPELFDDIHPKIANYLTGKISTELTVESDELYELANYAANFYSDKKSTADLKHIPSEVIETELAEKFGWSLDEIRNINVQDMEKLLITLNQRNNQERQMYENIGSNSSNDYIDEKTGMRIIGGQQMTQERKDAIAHRIKKNR